MTICMCACACACVWQWSTDNVRVVDSGSWSTGSTGVDRVDSDSSVDSRSTVDSGRQWSTADTRGHRVDRVDSGRQWSIVSRQQRGRQWVDSSRQCGRQVDRVDRVDSQGSGPRTPEHLLPRVCRCAECIGPGRQRTRAHQFEQDAIWASKKPGLEPSRYCK